MKFLEDSISFYYIIVDLEGKYCYANNLFQKRFSFISRNFIGQNFSITIHPDDVDCCNKAAEEIINQPDKILRLEVRKPDLKGNYYWTNWEFSAYFDTSGHLVGIKCIGYDITNLVNQKKKLAQMVRGQRKKNEELKKINSELDNFVYRVSHDLRSPVTSLLGLNHLLRTAKDEKENLLSLQEKSLKKLDKFIHDILDYSRNNRVSREYLEIDLTLLVKEIIENNQTHSNQEINIVIEDLPYLKQDKFRLTIILHNLISNAFKYIYRGQDKPIIKIHGYLKNGKCNIFIQDNGIGIRKEEQKKIFDMFYRATDREAGSGIGLYIVKEALQVIEGNIEVHSKFGEGSTFMVSFPNR